MRIAYRPCYPTVIAVVLVSAIAASAADQTVVLKAARMFDGKSKSLIPNGVVVVQGDKIVDVGSNLAGPAGAKMIDLGDATLSPGFMDAHTHLTLDFSGDFNKRRLEQLDLNVSEQAIRAVGYARTPVEAGFTTVRDVGSRFVSSREFEESEPLAAISIRRVGFVIFSSGANRITRMGSPMARMRFARPFASK